MSEPGTNGSGPITWRDIYKAVGDSEERVVAAISELRKDLTGTTTDHEARIRALETYAASLPHSERAALIARLGILEAAIRTSDAKSTGVFGTLKFGQALILLAFSAIGAISIVLNILDRLRL